MEWGGPVTPSPELQSKILLWRDHAAAGTITIDEMKEAIIALREGRISASIASDKSRAKKAVKAIPSADDLLKEIGEM
jgi:hypothetical protein